jgi:hypothetical protein
MAFVCAANEAFFDDTVSGKEKKYFYFLTIKPKQISLAGCTYSTQNTSMSVAFETHLY